MIRYPLATLLALTPLAAAHAAEEETPAVSVDYNAAIVSDYRFRGISYTERKPAVQGGVDLSFRSGLFLGAWASSLADYGGSHVEIDVYGGYGGKVAGFDYNAGAYVYLYPGGRGVNIVELQSSISHVIGPVTGTFTAAYTPQQRNADDNLYLSIGGDIAIIGTPLTASASFGRENGGYDHKYDWSAGLTWKLDRLDLSVSYVDSNYGGALEEGRNARAGVVMSAKAVF